MGKCVGGVEGGEGNCGKRYGGRCWGVGGGKERCMGRGVVGCMG